MKKKHCHMKKMLLCLLLLSAAKAGMSQADSLSRWSLGLEAGTSLYAECGICSYQQGSTFALPLALQAEYRLLRWLAFPIHLGYVRLNDRTSSRLNSDADWGIYDNSYRLQVWTLSAGVKLMLRLGQGDLGLSYRQGVDLRGMQQQIAGLDQPPISINYRSNVSQSEAIRLSYGYWPQPRLGITLAAEMFQANRTKRFELRQSPQELLPGFGESSQTTLLVSGPDAFLGNISSRGPYLINVLLGIHYRLGSLRQGRHESRHQQN
jgi:hypothetical protein